MLATQDIAVELQKATLDPGPAAPRVRRRRRGDDLPRGEGRRNLPGSLPRHAAMEPMNCTVHARDDGCEIWVGMPGCRARTGDRGDDIGDTAREGHGPRPPDRRWVRAGRLDVDGVTSAVRIAGTSDGRSRSSGPARRTSSTTCIVRIGWTGISGGLYADGRLDRPAQPVRRSSVIARWLPAGFQNGLDPDSTDGRHRPRLRHP